MREMKMEAQMETTVRMMKSKCCLQPEHDAAGSCPEFFTIFDPIINANRLKIPRAFRGHLRDTMPRRLVTVRNSGNKTWVVRLERQDGDYCFTYGWNELAIDQMLELGDFLVFRHEGGSTFCISSYGSNYRAKVSNCVQEEHQPSLVKGGINLKRKRGRPPIVGKGGNRALVTANKYATHSKHPHFKMVLTRAYLKNKTMHIHSEFATTYLKMTSTLVYLKISFKLWEVRICAFGKFYRFEDGWSEFKRDNHLQEGDICILELVDDAKLILSVSIFRCGISSRGVES